MGLKNSHLIARAYPFTDIFTRINKVDADLARRPVLVAWMLEDAALQSGWQEGPFLGTERELMEQFNISRDTLREAIRIVEARGSMQMQRGRRGGLQLLRPRTEDMAAALAAYLQAHNLTQAALRSAVSAGEPVLAMLGDEELFVTLYRQTAALFSTGKTPGTANANRAMNISSRLLESHGPPPENGIFLGNEALLCEQLGCTRPALREALRLLGDLSILTVRRGRGGGFSLVQPSPDAMIRRLFGLFASRHLTLADLMPSVFGLYLIRLRLAMRNLQLLDDQTRQLRCGEIASVLHQYSEPVRWFRLQGELDRVCGNKFISILAESFTYYLARLNQTDESWNAAITRWNEIDAALLAAGSELVQALRDGNAAEAERLHQNMHDHISWALNCPVKSRPIPALTRFCF